MEKVGMLGSGKYTTLGAVFLALLFMISAIPAHAVSGFATSSNVLVLNTQGTACANFFAGCFPTAAATGAGYTVTFMAAASVTGASSFTGKDTIVLWEYCAVGSSSTVDNALVSFLQGGGKIIIWDSDACNTVDGTAAVYSWLGGLGASFATNSPGQTGSFAGSLTIKEANNFLSGLSSGNMATLVSSTDAVGDLNVITTSSAAWCATLLGTNINQASGFADAYTAPGALAGAANAIIVYDGLDTNYIATTGGTATGGQILVSLVLNQLAHGWGNPAYTTDLTCSVPITGIKLDPVTATNPVGGSHTVTATVSDSNGAPVAGVTVTFTVTAGPNAGQTGSGVTDAAGHVTFTYSDSGGAGTDTITATFNDQTGAPHTATATKIWQPTTGVPEFGAPTTLMAAIALLAVTILSRRMRPSMGAPQP